MPYIVNRGNVIGAEGVVYEVGEEVPGNEGELADMEAAGSVVWQSGPSGPYAELTKKQLMALCGEREIGFVGKPNNDALIALLEASDAAGMPSTPETGDGDGDEGDDGDEGEQE